MRGFKSNSTNLLLLIMDLGVWTQIGLCQFLHFIFPPIRYKLLYSIMQVSRYFQSNDSEMYSQCDLKMEKSTIHKKEMDKKVSWYFFQKDREFSKLHYFSLNNRAHCDICSGLGNPIPKTLWIVDCELCVGNSIKVILCHITNCIFHFKYWNICFRYVTYYYIFSSS